VDGYRSGQHPVRIPAGVARRLRAPGRRGTLFMTLLTALSAALARHSPTGDVAVTSLVAGRRQAELQRLVGMYANPVVLRTATAGAGDFGALADRVRRDVLAAYGRQDVPFPLVADRCGIAAAEVWLNVAPPPAAARFRGLTVDTQALPRDYPIDVPAAAWRGEKLICNLADTGAEIVGLLDYNRNQLDPGTVAGLAEDLLAILADPDGTLPPTGDRPPL
jgi:glutamate racemase